MVSMEIVFALTRHEYDSYRDYRELVKLGGFPTCYVDQVNFAKPDTFYVVSPINGEWRPHRDVYKSNGSYNARVALWDLERPAGRGGLASYMAGAKDLLDHWYFDEIWLSDRWLADQAHDSRIRFVPLGSHTGLGTLERAKEFTYDFAHLSYTGPNRRSSLYGQLAGRNIRMMPNAWGQERKDNLVKTKFLLNVHQDDSPLIEPLRLTVGAAFGLPILSERILDAYPYTRLGETHNIIQAEYGELVGKAANLLNDDYGWHLAMGRRCHALMCLDYRFDRVVKEAVKTRPPERPFWELT
jgi:hypothetical protein